jgi:predicted AlkP superfamily pyrophosphatase or phosphodiesterase
MHFNFMPTYTGPGHASIYTGTTPDTHGIVGNEWFSRTLGEEMYCTDDASVSTLVMERRRRVKCHPRIC